MRSTHSENLSNPEPEIDTERYDDYDESEGLMTLTLLLAAQGLVWFLLGLIAGWWLWG